VGPHAEFFAPEQTGKALLSKSVNKEPVGQECSEEPRFLGNSFMDGDWGTKIVENSHTFKEK